MSSTTPLTLDSGRIKRFDWLKRPTVLIGLIIFLYWGIGSFAGPAFSSYGVFDQNINDSLVPPGVGHLWGTDKLGRDLFVRVLYGARISLPAGLLAVAVSTLIGVTIGALAGYAGKLWDELLMRITDVFFAFPAIILAMAIAAALGPSINNAIIAIAVISWPNYARVTRGLVLSVKTREYVEADRVIGATHLRTLTRTILPNCIGPLIVLMTIDFGNAILVFAGLSFLGLGPAPETPEWGRMIADGVEYADQWWVSGFPGIAIFTVVMALNFIGDALRDRFDPHSITR